MQRTVKNLLGRKYTIYLNANGMWQSVGINQKVYSTQQSIINAIRNYSIEK